MPTTPNLPLKFAKSFLLPLLLTAMAVPTAATPGKIPIGDVPSVAQPLRQVNAPNSSTQIANDRIAVMRG